MTQVLSYGGGRQTVAMCLLVEKGILPRPDYIIAADTGREAASTCEYLSDHIQPRMAALGLQVEIAPHSLATVDLYDASGGPLMPVYTATGKMQHFAATSGKRA